MQEQPDIGIIGVGLLGASLGLALKQRGFAGRIIGCARTQATIDTARRVGAIDRGHSQVSEVVDGCGLVVVAVPLGAFDAVFAELGKSVTPDTIITDLGSTKLMPTELAKTHLPAPGRFVAAHPMAGSENQGPEHADGDLFQGKPCIICPDESTDSDALSAVTSLWEMVGMQVITMTAAAHDDQAASISHLPHLAAVSLVQAANELGGWDMASTGMAGASRLASSTPSMRADIIMANASAIMQAIDVYMRQLGELGQAIERGDEKAVLELLSEAKQTRDNWMSKRQEVPARQRPSEP